MEEKRLCYKYLLNSIRVSYCSIEFLKKSSMFNVDGYFFYNKKYKYDVLGTNVIEQFSGIIFINHTSGVHEVVKILLLVCRRK